MFSTNSVIATLIDPAERSGVDAAAAGSFYPVHAATVTEAVRVVRERAVNAVLVSPVRLGPEQIGEISRMIRDFPGIPAIALVSTHNRQSSERLLFMGASGVSRVVDITHRDGWRSLRSLVSDEASPIGARILNTVMPALGDPTPTVRRFFEVMVWFGPTTPTVRALAKHLDVSASTFMSRFFRAGLPSPKRYLAAVRLLHATALFEIPGLSISDVAYRLEYSSPQSFGRHVRAVWDLSATAFREQCVFGGVLEDFVERLIFPYQATFRQFHPL